MFLVLQPVPKHSCSRPPFADCSEEAFIADVIDFLSKRKGRSIDSSKFPDAVLNGTPLDLYGLYREVVTRGGFRVGNGINWKGQVFAHMRNWTANNRQTGVGNSLKKHYANYLWEYEQVRKGAWAGVGGCACPGVEPEQSLDKILNCL